MSVNGQFVVTQYSTCGTAAYGLPLEKAKSSLTWSHGRHKYNNLVFTSIFSRLVRSVSEVQDDCCVRKPKYSSSVDGLFRHFKQNTKRYSSFSGCYNGLQKKKTILTIQRVKYFEQIGHFTFVQSAKIPHVRNERL